MAAGLLTRQAATIFTPEKVKSFRHIIPPKKCSGKRRKWHIYFPELINRKKADKEAPAGNRTSNTLILRYILDAYILSNTLIKPFRQLFSPVVHRGIHNFIHPPVDPVPFPPPKPFEDRAYPEILILQPKGSSFSPYWIWRISLYSFSVRAPVFPSLIRYSLPL